MKFQSYNVCLIFISCCVIGCKSISANLSCYNCIRNTNTECSPEELEQCPAVSDRCVTHIAKNNQQGFVIKRECGLGPCAFEDAMANKGLGLDHCDRSRDEYFCILCCRESGCNKSKSSHHFPSVGLIILSILLYSISKIQ